MGNFRNDRRGGGRGGFGRDRGSSRGGFGGRDRGDRGGGRGGFGGRDRKNFVKHEVTCDKCGKLTDVPFKPTTGKPIFCKECFEEGTYSGPSKSRNLNFNSNSETNSGNAAGISQEQFNKLNSKLDRILKILEQIEFEEEMEEGEEE